MRRLRFLLPFLNPYRSILLAGLGWLLVTDLFGLLGPWLLKVGIDAVQGQELTTLYAAALLLVTASLLRYMTRSRSRHCFLHTACRMENDLRRDLLARLLKQSGPFFDRFRTGDLLSRFTNDIANLRTLAGFGTMIFGNTLIVYAMTLVVLLKLSPVLTFIALLPYPLLFFLTRYLSGRLLKASARVQRGLGQVSEALEEGISGQAVIRSYGLRSLRGACFDALNERYLEDSLTLARLRNAIGPSMALIAPLGTLLIFYFGGRQVIAQQLSLGELVAFNAYLVQLTMPTLMLGWIFGLVQRGAASVDRLVDILHAEEPPEGFAIAGGERPPAVSLTHLHFGYGDKPVLRDLSMDVGAGALVGIAGPTGSGKSTLLRLLAGLYPAPEGQMLIDGHDLTRLDGSEHRRRVAMVSQEGRLFSGTLRDNLLYAGSDESEEFLQNVAQAVCLDEEVAHFSRGFDTRVGEGGKALSGGQRQRVCIGRALAKGGSLWLLDDPFSHLDAATARTVWRRLRDLLVGKTVFLASGHASLLAATDRILVLDGGRLVESGTYESLIAQGGLYARLLEKERLQRELEGLA